MLINTHHSRFIPEGVAEASQIFVRDATISDATYTLRKVGVVLPKLVLYEEY
jgi:hypothetical protein